MILVIDNYDSFVHNLARYVENCGQTTRIVRNDSISISDIYQLSPKAIIISPGPCSPNEAGISLAVVKQCAPHIPILGVCLGHQAIGQVYGGEVVRASKPMHGKASSITHDGQGLFARVRSPLQVGRYHSLVVALPSDNTELHVTARSDDGTIMALRHTTYPCYGVQFHPESILTEDGMAILRNFVRLAEEFHGGRNVIAA